MYIRFDDNATVIVNVDNNPRGTDGYLGLLREKFEIRIFLKLFRSAGGFISNKAKNSPKKW
jgi:ribosomal protein L14